MELSELFSVQFAVRDKDDKLIQFSLKQNQNTHRNYRSADGAMHCYTPHADTEGRFWTWTYRPRRSGRAKLWVAVDLKQRCSRAAAKRDALQRADEARAKRAQRSRSLAQ